ncbi:MAG: hypothetical protein F6J87_13135 [Spirulina sp. SIO3F2]|nr:hypothetical protein [Spirulina sp. SIO3F2]
MIRKKARPRNPEEPVVATFMIAYDKWQAFKTVLEAEGTTISAALVAFVEGYLAAVRSPNLSSQEINSRLQLLLRHKTDHWEQQVTTLQHRVLKTEANVADLNFSVEQLQRERSARPVEIDANVTPVDPHDVIVDIDLEETNDPKHDALQPDGLTQASLCRAFGIKPQSLIRNANLRGMTLENYLYHLTGWSYRQGRYYPP